MDDLISRQKAIEAFEKELTIAESNGKCVTIASAVTFTGAKQILEGLPSIDAVPQWILCSERLPEEGIEVVTVDKDGEYEINHIIDEEDGEWFLGKPVAWMSLSTNRYSFVKEPHDSVWTIILQPYEGKEE